MAQAVTNVDFTMEKILRKRIRSNKIEYYVKWLEHSDDSNSWVDEKSCDEKLIHEYEIMSTKEYPVEKVLDKRIRFGKVSC